MYTSSRIGDGDLELWGSRVMRFGLAWDSEGRWRRWGWAVCSLLFIIWYYNQNYRGRTGDGDLELVWGMVWYETVMREFDWDPLGLEVESLNLVPFPRFCLSTSSEPDLLVQSSHHPIIPITIPMFYVMGRTFRPQRLGEVDQKNKNAIGNRLHHDGDLIGHYIQNTGYAHSFACYPTLETPLFICISSAPLGGILLQSLLSLFTRTSPSGCDFFIYGGLPFFSPYLSCFSSLRFVLVYLWLVSF